jgi:hypothetical protein
MEFKKTPRSQTKAVLLYLKIWFDLLKYPVLFLATFLLVTRYGQGIWVEVFKLVVSIAVSIGIVWIIASELWKNRTRLNLIWRVYFQSGILTYVRACFIFIATMTTVIVLATWSPEFLHWGWAQLIFGQATNVALQPFVTIEQVSPIDQTSPILPIFMMVLFWGLMILTLPFLAEVEEQIFRQGVCTWKGILWNSLLFGLAHLLMGIPIFIGLALFVPGFLFACRYKYAYHHHLRQFQNELAAQQAGVLASTADHAVYNALLITGFVAVMLSFKVWGN